MIKNIYVIFIFIITCSLKAQSLYESGRDKYSKGNFDEAIQLFTKSIDAAENVFESYVFLGASYSFKEDFNTAKINFDKAQKINSERYLLKYYLGKFYFLRGDYENSICMYNDAMIVAEESDKDEVYDARSIVNFLTKNYEEAFEDISKAIRLDNFNPSYYYNRAYLLMNTKFYKKAIIDFNKAIILNPNSIKYFYNRGLSYFNSDDFENAILDMTKVLSLKENDAEALLYRGISYYHVGKYKLACEDLNRSESLGYNIDKPDDLKCSK